MHAVCYKMLHDQMQMRDQY